MPQKLQPFLHDLVTTFASPTQVLSGVTGDIAMPSDGPCAQGILHADIRIISNLAVKVGGRSPEHIATQQAASSTTFISVLRHVGADLVSIPDPQVRLDRQRQVSAGVVSETLNISSLLPQQVATAVDVTLASDFLPIEQIKVGLGSAPIPFLGEPIDDVFVWSDGDLEITLNAPGTAFEFSADRTTLTLHWSITIAAESSTAVGWTLQVSDTGSAVVAATTPALDIAKIAQQVAERVTAAGRVEHRLQPWIEQSLADLNSLRMATAAAPDQTFFAAGAPWYLTLFGRDSLWAARLLLPVDIGHAEGTLRTLALYQGSKTDAASAESPGKIIHELRRGQFSFGETSLPPLYYGTIDATPLWICLLHDAWQAGMSEKVVRDLLPQLRAALDWIRTDGDADGDGFCEYIDTSGHGLANQGWKDSGDSVRFDDGSIAEGPVALCEVQGYAFEAAVSGAALLDAFELPGGDDWRAWAANLADRFRRLFWCGEGEDSYPALALDGNKQRVDAVTSNIGHLLGTGILNAEEEERVARRVSAADLDSGLGLRTMSSEAGGYSPLSYHCGSVWPHDTAIVIHGLQRSGHLEQAAGLIEGLLRASVVFDARFPELWSGEGQGVPYPAACRPQAWSAASAVTVAAALWAPDGAF